MTLINDIERLMNEYRSWLKEKTSLREIDGAFAERVEITTPYLDRNNDALQIYARRTPKGFILTDDSYVIHDLEASGCSLDTQKRKELLKTTLNGFGVKLNEDALEVQATPETFPMRKHNLVQAMLAVNDLFFTAKSIVESLFLEDVTAWLDQNDVRYIPQVKFTGMSGYDHLFDFAIPKSRTAPERFLQAINRPSRPAAESFILKWTDTKEVRPADSKAYAILNDTRGQKVPGEVFDAFLAYDISPIPWSRREQVQSELVA